MLWSLQFITQSEGITEGAGRTLRAPEPREFFSDDAVLLLHGAGINARPGDAGVMLLFTTIYTARPILAIGIVLAVNAIANAQSVCDHVSRITIMPFRGESGLDADYDAIVAAGKSAVPCLIQKITDSTLKDDPRQIPRWGDLKTTVGDTAVVMLEIVTHVDIIKMLPRRYQRRYKQIGVYAELEYLHARNDNRRRLQQKLRRWYRTTYLPSLRKAAA